MMALKKGVRLLSSALAIFAVAIALLAAPGCSQDLALSGSSMADTSSFSASGMSSEPLWGEPQSEVSRSQDEESRPLSPDDGEYMIPITENGKYVLFEDATTVVAEKDGVVLKHVKMKIKGYNYDDPGYEQLSEPEYVGALYLFDSASLEGRLLTLLGRNTKVKNMAGHGSSVYLWLSRWWAFGEGAPGKIVIFDFEGKTVRDVHDIGFPSCKLFGEHLYMLDYYGYLCRLDIAGGQIEKLAHLPESFRNGFVGISEKAGNIITFGVADIATSEKVNLRYNLDTGAFEYDADPRDFDY